jgi:hypothetical protein
MKDQRKTESFATFKTLFVNGDDKKKSPACLFSPFDQAVCVITISIGVCQRCRLNIDKHQSACEGLTRAESHYADADYSLQRYSKVFKLIHFPHSPGR